MILNHVGSRLRSITRSFGLDEIHLAEEKFNHGFSRGIVLPEGLTIYHLNVRLAPDLTASEYLAERRRLRRFRDLAAEKHEEAKVDAIRVNEIKQIEHAGELERRKAALDAMLGLTLDPYQLLLAYVAENPHGSEEVFEFLNDAWKAGIDHEEARDTRSTDLLKYLIDKGVVQAVDIERFRDDLTDRVREAASQKHSNVAGWAEPSVLPHMKLRQAPSAPPPRSSGNEPSTNGARRH